MAPRKRLGALLIEMGVIDEHQLNSALGHQKQWGGKLGSVLVQKGLCKEADVVRVLSVHLGMPVIHLGQAQIEPRALKMISRQIAEKLRVFPVSLQGAGRSELLTIAMAEPSDLSLVDQVAFHTGKRIKPVLTGESEIATAIALYYNENGSGQPKPAAGAPASGRFANKPGATDPAVHAAPPSAPNQSAFANNPFAPSRAPASISQRPAPPAITPPVMAPVGQSTAPFGSRPPPTRTQASNPPPAYTSTPARSAPPAQATLPTPSFFPGPTPAPKPQPPLEEIESIDLDSIPGMSGALDSSGRMEGLEPIAAHSQAPETVGWDEAPSTDPSLSAAGQQQVDAWTDDAPPAAPDEEDQPAAHGWDDAPAPPPEPQFAQPGAWSNSSDGAIRTPFYKDTMPGAPPQAALQTMPGGPPLVEDELPADAIFGTADENEQLAEPAPGAHEAAPEPQAPAHVSVEFESSAAEFAAAPADEYQSAPTVSEMQVLPSFFEEPLAAEPVQPAPADESADTPVLQPQQAQGVAVTEPALDVALPLVDPWADLAMTDGAGSDEPGPATAHEAWVADQVGSQAFTETIETQLEAPGVDLAPAAPDVESPPEAAPASSAQPFTESNIPWPSPDEALASVGARMQTSPGAFTSMPGSIVAPAAWGEVEDPLGVPTEPEPPFAEAFAAARADDAAAAVDDAQAAGDVHAADDWSIAEPAPPRAQAEPAPEVVEPEAAAHESAAHDAPAATWDRPVALPTSTTPDEPAFAQDPLAAAEPEVTADVAFNSDEFAPVSAPAAEPEPSSRPDAETPAIEAAAETPHETAELSHEEVWPDAETEAAPVAEVAPAADAAPVAETEPTSEPAHQEDAAPPAAEAAPEPPAFAAPPPVAVAEEPASAELPAALLANDPIIDHAAPEAPAAAASHEIVSESHEAPAAAASHEIVSESHEAPAAAASHEIVSESHEAPADAAPQEIVSEVHEAPAPVAAAPAHDEVVAHEELAGEFADEEAPAPEAAFELGHEELIAETPVELSPEELAPDAVDEQPAAHAGAAEALPEHLALPHPGAPLSAYDIETLAGVGIDANDSTGAMRLLAALLRVLAARQVIDLGELTVDLYAQRSAAPEAGERDSAQDALADPPRDS